MIVTNSQELYKKNLSVTCFFKQKVLSVRTQEKKKMDFQHQNSSSLSLSIRILKNQNSFLFHLLLQTTIRTSSTILWSQNTLRLNCLETFRTIWKILETITAIWKEQTAFKLLFKVQSISVTRATKR